VRVNIQYSIEMEELEEETLRILKKAVNQIDGKLLKKVAQPDNLLSLTSATMIDEMRQSLANADILLRDVHNIITGYLQYKSAPTQEAPVMPANVPLDELQDKLHAFKDLMAQQEQNEISD